MKGKTLHPYPVIMRVKVLLERKVNVWLQRLKIIIPHLCLLGLAVTYSLVGAVIFTHLEKKPSSGPANQEEALDHLNKYKMEIADKLWTIGKTRKGYGLAEQEIAKFAKNIEKLHSTGLLNRKEVENHFVTNPRIRMQPSVSSEPTSQAWSFGSAIFFVVTTLTTIGYGNVVPTTQASRISCIAYCIVGIPLFLIFTANLAKFLGVGVTKLYVKFVKFKQRIRNAFYYLRTGEHVLKPQRTDMDAMADLLYREIENAEVVNVSAWVVYSIIISYALLGGAIFSWLEPEWTFLDSFYFSFISILKVGFGEVLPSSGVSRAMTLLYSFCGLVITTMCVDVAGVRFLDQLHEFGRIKRPSYLEVLKRTHYVHKRRGAMGALHRTVTAVRHMAISVSSTTISSVAPTTPEDVRVIEITPYSMKLAWIPPDSPSSSTKYLLKYKMKNDPFPFIDDYEDDLDRSFGGKSKWFFQLGRGEHQLVIKDLIIGQCEVKGLKSFSIYEMSLRAISNKGTSSETRLVQITEPASAPQDMNVEMVDSRTLYLTWNEPYTKKKDVEGYTVYYTTCASTAFEHWGKVMVDREDYSVQLRDLQPNVQYTVCMCSRYNKGHSPISRAIVIDTAPADPSSQRNINDEAL